MEGGGFFGFDTSLPPVRRGPQQEFGDVELEDTYDALNDETFGILNTEEDWEEEHEKLAEILGDVSKGEEENNQKIPSSRNYMLDDDEEEEFAYPGPQPTGLRTARIGRSGNVEFESDNQDAANVAASVSQMILDDDDIESILSRPMNYPKSMGSKLFERMSPPSSLFDSDIVGSPSTPSIWSTQPSDIRHHIKESPQRNIQTTIPKQNASPAGLMQSNGLYKTVADLERDLLNQPKHHTLEELERNILRPPFMRPPVGLPPPLGMPMPLPPNLRGMNMNGNVILPQMGQWPPGFPPNLPTMSPNENSNRPAANDHHRHHHQHHHHHDDSYDEYSGLMSMKEKQWLMSIQINQLISDNPYVDDYYFTVLRLRCLGKLRQGQEGNKDGPKLILPERANKIEAKIYAPAQFANSLGKLQVVTYTAPRRIIDVSITQPSESGQDPQVAARDLRKFKQILLDIESMYVWLLDLEDAEIRVEESSPEDADLGPHHQAAADYQQKLQNFLSNGDRLLQAMYVRKGKVLILRAWPRLTVKFQELIVKTMLLNCIALIRRDTNDHVLVRFLPLVNECMASLVELDGLVNMAQLMESAQKNIADTSITSTKMGLDLISLLMCRGSELFPRCQDESARNQWSSFVTNLSQSLLNTPVLHSDLSLLTLEPFEQIGLDDLTLNRLKTALDQLVSSI